MSAVLVPHAEVRAGAGSEEEGRLGEQASGGSASRLPNVASTAVLLVALDLSVSLPHLLAARLLALSIALFLPGALAVEAARARFGSRYAEGALALGASLVVLMGWAVVASSLLPAFGVARPLAKEPFAVGLNFICLTLALCCPAGRDPVLRLLQPGQRLCRGLWQVALLLPVMALAAVERLNSGHGSLLVQATIVASALALIGGFLQARNGRHLRAQMCLFSAALALLYLYSFRGNYLFGYDIQQEFQRFSYTFARARWVPPADGDPYAAMLSITALPAALSRLTSVSGLYLMKGLYPLFVALVPGLSYEFALRWLKGRAAFFGAAYMVVLADFSSQLPALARQETAFLFFSLLVLALFATELEGSRRQGVLAVLLGALVVSHYSTSYVGVVILASTWVVYGLFRLAATLRARGRRGLHRLPRPAVGLVTVLLGAGMVLVWDVVVTHSSSNVTNFVTSLADEGVQVLPYGKGESLLQRYLSGNVGTTMSPAGYYAATARAARAQEPWLQPFPSSVTRQFPAQAAPRTYELKALLPGSAKPVADVTILVDELLLLAIAVGVAICFVQHLRRKGGTVPLEVAAMSLGFFVFLGLIRLSGTVAGSYNADRAQLQASIVLAVALGASAEWLMARLRASALAVAALVVLLLAGTGESAVLTGGDPSALLANAGTEYDYFVISAGEVSAAQWLVANMGHGAVVYTDEFGPLRIWDATGYAPTPHTWLTPGALDRGAWVYVPAYDIVEGRSYGSINGAGVTYRFPAKFLSYVDDLVYSDPTSRVYH